MWKPLTGFYVPQPGNIRFRTGSRMFPDWKMYGSALRNVKDKRMYPSNQTNLSLSFYLENKMPPSSIKKHKKMVHERILSSMNHFLHLYTLSGQLIYQLFSSIDLAIPISSPLSSASPLRRPRQEYPGLVFFFKSSII